MDRLQNVSEQVKFIVDLDMRAGLVAVVPRVVQKCYFNQLNLLVSKLVSFT